MTPAAYTARAWTDSEGRPHVSYWSNDHESIQRAIEIASLPRSERAAATQQWFDDVLKQQEQKEMQKEIDWDFEIEIAAEGIEGFHIPMVFGAWSDVYGTNWWPQATWT